MPEILWPQFLFGIALSLFGWALYWTLLHLTGGLLGASIAGTVVWALLGVLDMQGRFAWDWPVIAAATIGFLLGIWLMRNLHRLAFFLVGAALGLVLGKLSYEFLLDRGLWIGAGGLWWQIGIVGGGILLFGLGMLQGSRYFVMAITAVAGALLAALAISDSLALLAVPPLALASFFLQTGLLKRLAPRRKDPDHGED